MKLELKTFDGKNNTFYFTTTISDNLELLENGTLRCNNVIMGRTGVQQYTSRELGLSKQIGDRVINVNRHEEDVFHEETLKSIEGKPITLGHPKDENGQPINVTSKNIDIYRVGNILNVRRVGDNIVGDIIIDNEEIINQIINKDVRELSLGYSSVYEVDGDDALKQTKIIVNHLALVERGRAGNAMIVDEANENIEKGELPLKKETFVERFLRIFGIKDATFADEVVEDNENQEDEPKEEDKKVKEKVANDENENEVKEKQDDENENNKEAETTNVELKAQETNGKGEDNSMTLDEALKKIAEIEPLKGTEAYDVAMKTIDSEMVEAGLGSILIQTKKVEIFNDITPKKEETRDGQKVFTGKDFIGGIQSIYNEYTPKALNKHSRNTVDRAFRIKELGSIDAQDLIKRN